MPKPPNEQTSVIQIGPYKLDSNIVLAPMAGVTDRPFRSLCRHHGAALTPSEMLTSNMKLWHSEKNRLRREHCTEERPRVVQIAGSDPQQMALAAQKNVEHGAQIIDINMGCPAKKVLKKAAGSALLKDEKLVAQILQAVTSAVNVPVTLKIRTGWSPELRNGLTIAKIAEENNIKALAVHGRTRECAFKGAVEYDTIAEISAALSIPVFANGDINSAEKAKQVLAYTQADGIMIGRAAQERPWVFQQIEHYLQHNTHLQDPTAAKCGEILLSHVQSLYEFYGEFKGVMIARKHVAWQLQRFDGAREFKKLFNQLQSPESQLDGIRQFISTLIKQEVIAA